MRSSFARLRQECLIGIKAYQDLILALDFAKYAKKSIHVDETCLASSFHALIISYAKPFTDAHIDGGKIRYKVSVLRKEPTFNFTYHKKILDIRNTLIAHNDLKHLEARILMCCLSVEDIKVPTEIILSGKSLAYANSESFYDDFIKHTTLAIHVIENKIIDDIKLLREAQIKAPAEAKSSQKFEQHLGTEHIPIQGKRVTPPSCVNSEYLGIPTPEYAEEADGFVYKTITVKLSFNGPEEIALPNGGKLTLTP